MGVFTEIEKEAIRDFISLYKNYLSGDNRANVVENAEELLQKYCSGYYVLSAEVAFAIKNAQAISRNRLSRKDIKNILSKLEKKQRTFK
ncbi:hypothetical protein SMSP2_01789 [Limihaloglobus sulfuriphilus]|uniref:Uncharacterized protein n=1 Tax=Limihaloglobus sulfuriphilus TaxID=1851148 RepID=A0A1Q2MFD1_9BACT|nr:hypothetical protein [Limihaloglobus sulfuriphilus]AQQ71415.1 hypothetical protein SMSP2_01789 [Limihaloglobus sulfuriphilus]